MGRRKPIRQSTHIPSEMDLTETKIHVLKASREILLAAEGALSFCKHYVQTSDKERKNPKLATFFSRALDVVGSLAGDLRTNDKKRS